MQVRPSTCIDVRGVAGRRGGTRLHNHSQPILVIRLAIANSRLAVTITSTLLTAKAFRSTLPLSFEPSPGYPFVATKSPSSDVLLARCGAPRRDERPHQPFRPATGLAGASDSRRPLLLLQLQIQGHAMDQARGYDVSRRGKEVSVASRRRAFFVCPGPLVNTLQRALANQPWKEYTAEGGRKYWYNTETKQSSWEMPDIYKSALAASSGPSTPA